MFHEVVVSDGRKMSKHLGNVVDPDALIERFGADTVRLAVLYAARPQRSLNWSESAALRCHRFLTQVHDYVHASVATTQTLASADGARESAEASAEASERDTTEHLPKRLAGWV